MALTLAEKKAVVAEVSEVAKGALSLVAADYRGLNVSEMTELRAKARDNDVYLRVVPNTLSKRALAETDFETISDELVGPQFLAFSQEAPGAAARLLRDFVKDHEALSVTALAIGGKTLPASQLDAVANLPTKDEAIAKLLFVMKEPIAKFVRTMAEPHAKLVRTIAAIRDQKQNSQ